MIIWIIMVLINTKFLDTADNLIEWISNFISYIAIFYTIALLSPLLSLLLIDRFEAYYGTIVKKILKFVIPGTLWAAIFASMALTILQTYDPLIWEDHIVNDYWGIAFVSSIAVSTAAWVSGVYIVARNIILNAWGTTLDFPLWGIYLYSAFSYFIIVEPANLAYLDFKLNVI
jgi:hypothetical protein